MSNITFSMSEDGIVVAEKSNNFSLFSDPIVITAERLVSSTILDSKYAKNSKLVLSLYEEKDVKSLKTLARYIDDELNLGGKLQPLVYEKGLVPTISVKTDQVFLLDLYPQMGATVWCEMKLTGVYHAKEKSYASITMEGLDVVESMEEDPYVI